MMELTDLRVRGVVLVVRVDRGEGAREVAVRRHNAVPLADTEEGLADANVISGRRPSLMSCMHPSLFSFLRFGR